MALQQGMQKGLRADLEDDAVGAGELVLDLEGDVGADARLQQQLHVLAHVRRRHLQRTHRRFTYFRDKNASLVFN